MASAAAAYKKDPDFFDKIIGREFRGKCRDVMVYTGLTHIKKQQQVFSLGGRRNGEYLDHLANGIVFEPYTYHNVDEEEIEYNPGVVALSNRQFRTISSDFTNPVLIIYDSTMGITKKNRNEFRNCVKVAFEGTLISGRLVFIVNIVKRKARNFEDFDLFMNEIASVADDYLEIEIKEVPVHFRSIEKRKGSNTEMIFAAFELLRR